MKSLSFAPRDAASSLPRSFSFQLSSFFALPLPRKSSSDTFASMDHGALISAMASRLLGKPKKQFSRRFQIFTDRFNAGAEAPPPPTLPKAPHRTNGAVRFSARSIACGGRVSTNEETNGCASSREMA